MATELPISFHRRFGFDQAVRPPLAYQVLVPIRANLTIDDDVRHMDTPRTQFAGHALRDYVENNPVRGVKRFADAQKKAPLTAEQYRALALTLEAPGDKRDRKGERVHSAVGLAAIRFIALTGVRRGECENLKWDEVDAKGTCIALGETKTRPSLRLSSLASSGA